MLTIICVLLAGMPGVSNAEGESGDPGTPVSVQTEDPVPADTGSAEEAAPAAEGGAECVKEEAPDADGDEGSLPLDEESQDVPDDADKADEAAEGPPAEPSGILREMASGDTVSYTSKEEHTGTAELEIPAFKITMDGKNYEGTCAQIGVKALRKGTATVTKISNSSRHAKMIYKYAILMDWWRGPAGEVSAKKELGLTGTVKTTNRILLKCMNQICKQGSGWKKSAVNEGGMAESFVNVIYKHVSGLDVSDVNVPDTFEMYYCDAGEGQNFTVWRYIKGGIASTSARDRASGSHSMIAGENGAIIDTVRYQDMLTTEQYTVTATVFDKTAGRMLSSSATANLKPASASGSIDIVIPVDTTGLEDHTLVVYESLKSAGQEISAHRDASNRDQTVYVPSIGTSAADTGTGTHIASAGEVLEIRDSVSYSNLVPGETYEMKGVLMDKESGEPLLSGGETVTSSQSFKPDAPDGTVELIFTVRRDELEGKTLVVFEDCLARGTVVAYHKDIEDEEQSVHVPRLATEAGIQEDDSIVDNISYENLLPGKSYTVRGYLVDKLSEQAVAGSEGETSFTADGPDGSVDVRLHSGDSYGKLVAFETLFINEEGEGDSESPEEMAVAEHKDINCEEQSVVVEEEEEIPDTEDRQTPYTGDNTVLKVWTAFMVSACLALTLMILSRMKRRS